jgi:hypothetical protein
MNYGKVLYHKRAVDEFFRRRGLTYRLARAHFTARWFQKR